MKTFTRIALLSCLGVFASNAQHRLIVRTPLGEANLRSTCKLLGCNVQWALGDPANQLFLLTVPNAVSLDPALDFLRTSGGVVSLEIDARAAIARDGRAVPEYLFKSDPVPFFGSSNRYGYVFQPAAHIIRLHDTHQNFAVQGTGIVAVVDTGVDPDHPVLASVLLPGYDFTRNRSSASEKADVDQSTAAVVDGGTALFVNGDTAALVDQSTAAVVDNPDRSGFGHGTMVSGVIHLVAPKARILPLKAFDAKGSGYTSDILRAIYAAVRANATVINMSFSMPNASVELRRAVDYAKSSNIVCVASAGNEGSPSRRYPAAFAGVIAVGATDNGDQRSIFSNYGADWVYVGAPGEGVITTYPYGTFAAAWGTSFSTPFVSGTVALLSHANPQLSPQGVASALARAQKISPELGHGRLDLFQAVSQAKMLQ